jgi:spermidine/putrescine transport system permease protein
LFFIISPYYNFPLQFFAKGLYGGVIFRFSLDAYAALSNPTFITVALNTLFIAAVSSVAMVSLALPTAYFIARTPIKIFFIILVIIPFWTNFLIRIYAWIAILETMAFSIIFCFSTGLIEHHFQFLYKQVVCFLVTTYTYLTFAILPIIFNNRKIRLFSA